MLAKHANLNFHLQVRFAVSAQIIGFLGSINYDCHPEPPTQAL